MINVKFLTHAGAPERLIVEAKKKLLAAFPDLQFQFFSTDPDMLVFLTGGSEMDVTQMAKPGRFYILAASEGKNAYAAATEVKAWMNQNNINSVLIDLNNEADRKRAAHYASMAQKLATLRGQTLGLIGEISEWLIASNTTPEVLARVLGITLKQFSWQQLSDHRTAKPDRGFMKKFHTGSAHATEDAARVHTTLLETIAREKLDAITVGCFDLVRQHEVTACLSLAHLSDQGIAAGCEGDTCSAAAMMFAKAICGIIPWMANVAMVSANMLRLAHCTTPTLLLSEFEVDTHYETGLGTAIAGKFAGEDITIFRFDKELQKAFITQGKITSTHKRLHACRTQIEVAINEQDALLLRENPLGNHHLVLPGKNAAMLADACALCGIQLVS